MLLARLALSSDLLDWSNLQTVARLRILDPACGTGTLLMAALQAIKVRVAAGTELDSTDQAELHRILVEQVLCGLDINRHGVQLAACNLTLGAPTVDYQHMNLLTMRHGPQPDGSVAAGSLEILRAVSGKAVTDNPLLAHVQPLRSLDNLHAEQVDEAQGEGFPLADLDVMIMNPPFTDSQKKGKKFDKNILKKMQDHEKIIRDELIIRDWDAGNAIAGKIIRSFFSPLADALLKADRATLAMVMPTSAITASSGRTERCFLAARFHVELIVTTHHPKQINFSENTDIHECLVVCRRYKSAQNRPPTEFVSLSRMPASPEDASQLADAIACGELGDWGQSCVWPAEQVRSGDWTPVQWFDGGLAQVCLEIEESHHLEPAGARYEIGPAGPGIVQSAFKIGGPNDVGAVQGFHSVSSRLRRTIEGQSDVWYRPLPGKEEEAKRLWQRRSSHLMVAMRHNTISGRITAVWSPVTSAGWWVPVGVKDEDKAKSLAVWWNSTPAKLLLLNRRARTLTYPQWQLAHLREIRIPTPDNQGWDALRAAYDLVCHEELLPMKQAAEDPAREIIDAAAAEVLKMGEVTLADWRLRVSQEPMITNRPASG